MRIRSVTVLIWSAVFLAGMVSIRIAATNSAETLPVGGAADALDRQFSDDIVPFLTKHCFACHGENKQAAKLDLRSHRSLDSVARDHQLWELIRERIQAEEMPPEDAPQPTENERAGVLRWIKDFQDREAQRNAGDPGQVLARRLSNAEFDYTIHDLTGVDIRPTREFPVDPANEAGFDNSGESLTVSPALLKKSLAAARFVADHLVLTAAGIEFAPHPVVTDTDRDRYCVHRIVDFYSQHRVDFADYFFAAWDNEHPAEGAPKRPLAEVAREAELSVRYLTTLHGTLTEDRPRTGPLGQIVDGWRKLPAGRDAIADVRRGCEALRDLVGMLRPPLEPKSDRLKVEGISPGSQPLILWWNRQVAGRRMACQTARSGDEARDDELFCRLFPSAFFVVDRGPYFDPKGAGQGRLLTAGFHLMQGYFRDDQPLYELVLDDRERDDIDRLWAELNLITQAPQRQYRDFIFFERAEPPRFMQGAAFDFARSEDKDSTTPEKIQQLAAAYRARAVELNAGEMALQAIDEYFERSGTEIRQVEEGRKSAAPLQLAALVQFARRAYRRPLSDEEQAELLEFCRRLREADGLSHEESLRDAVASILVSPHFGFRIQTAEAGKGPHPLSSNELASRLSYFLWSTMPDAELLRHAEAGDLAEPEILRRQTRRMVRDPRIRHLMIEFTGNWLEFRRFEEHNAVDRERFPAFTNELREAMFEEPVRFLVDLAQRNGSVLECVTAEHTIVNAALARHYGIPHSEEGGDAWRRVDAAGRYGRGGLLPMAVFLTKSSPGLRTSPVKRGYWVVRRLLGEHIPPPPPGVPELPKDESQLGELTLPQVLARHRDNKACAGCHQRFDSVGMAFEGFGPVGERRTLDLGGHPVQTQAVYPDGSERTDLDGLRAYLIERRQADFVENFCRKLYIYALGRSLIPSDTVTINEIKRRLANENYQFGTLIEAIVLSPQFLNKRGQDDPRQKN